MINISDELKQHFLYDCVSKEIILQFPDINFEIGNANIVSESFELVNSIMDDNEFVLGGCIAGQMKIRIIDVERDLSGKDVNVFLKIKYAESLYPSNNLYPSNTLFVGQKVSEIEYQLFSGKIDSAKRDTSNRKIKELIAYDKMYTASNIKITTDISDYSLRSPNITLKDFIYPFAISIDSNYSPITSEFNDNTELSFTDYELAKSSETANLTVIDVYRSYCELNSSFAYIDRTGYLRNKSIWYSDIKAEEISFYQNLKIEEYVTAPITRIEFPYNKNLYYTGGVRSAQTSNYIADNCITKYCTDIKKFVSNFYIYSPAEINRIYLDVYRYRPLKATLFSYFWLEPGDKVRIYTGYEDTPYAESFVFSRTIKGINSMRVTVESKGKQYFGKEEITK